jgi:ADP-ribose pyrophosphatase
MKIKPDIVFHTPWFQIGAVAPGAESSGTSDPYYCLVRAPGVLACMLDAEGRLVLVEQYRPPLGRTTLEMPAGAIEDGETPEQAVIREAIEETGYVCHQWLEISPMRIMLNREDVIEYFYTGLDAHKALTGQATERAKVRLVKRDDFLDMVKSGQFEQTLALGGMYLAEKIFDVDLLTMSLEEIKAKVEVGRRKGTRTEP